MTSESDKQGLSLYDAARAMGVPFAKEVEPTDRYASANGLRFHYLDWGDPDNPPMLLLHGFAQPCHSWDFIALTFSDRFRVIAMDQRGHGDTDWAPDGDYTPEAHRKDTHAFVQAIDLENFVLIGLSMGGRNALTYAANHPERVRAVAIVDAAPETMRAGGENIRRFVQQDDELDSVDEFVERVLKYNPRRSAQQVRGSIMHNLKQLPSGKWTWKYDKLLRSSDKRWQSDPGLTDRLWGYVDSLKPPTLVVRGSKSDLIASQTAEEMHRRMPNGALTTVEGAGHLVPGDRPAGFANAVTEFLASLE